MSFCSTLGCSNLVHSRSLCKKHYTHQWHASNKEHETAYQNRYRHTRNGCLRTRYGAMKARVAGTKQSRNQEKYTGLPIMTSKEFKDWVDNDPTKVYDGLFNAWKASGFLTSLAPSVDRINSNKGYTLDNVEWMTWAKNRSKSDR